jgi:vacuolar-type H+-ATPase subunit H
MGSDGPARRREIENTTAARLAEIVAAAERAAKQVIDEAEEEARTRIADAHEEAGRIVAARLAGLGDLTDEINAQAEALVRQAEALQQALARAKAEMGGAEVPGGSPPMGRRESEMARREPESDLGSRKPVGPSLTVVGGVHEQPGSESDRGGAGAPEDRFARELGAQEGPAAAGSAPSRNDRRLHDRAPVDPPPPAAASPDFDDEISLNNGSPAGARLLATQMAVSGSSRAEIEARLRNGFKIADTRAILDAILGPEN